VVQVYVHSPRVTVYGPPQALAGFAKVRLAPGESRRVSVVLAPRAFASWDEGRRGWVVEPGTHEVRVGSSSRDIRARAHVQCASAERPTPREVPAVYRNVTAAGGFSREAFVALYGGPLPENAHDPQGAYTINTPLADMQASPVARWLHARLFIEARKALKLGDREIPLILRSYLDEASLRTLVTASRGGLRRPVLEALLTLCNGKYPSGALELARAALGDLWR
jgi:beta-glucosidase